MKLYSRNADTHVIAHPDHGEFEPDEDGAFELPDELGEPLNNLGGPGTHWENSAQRSVRLEQEQNDYLNSPRALHDLILGQAAAAAEKSAAPPTPAELRAHAKKMLDAADAADEAAEKEAADKAKAVKEKAAEKAAEKAVAAKAEEREEKAAARK